MRLRITFLGTGPAGRIPRPGCNRPICKEARKKGSKSARLQSSVFFEFPRFSAKGGFASGGNVLIDVTQDFKKQLKLIGGKKIDYVFLTHSHSDAAGGLSELTRYMRQTEMPEIVYIERHTLKVASKEMPSIDLPFHHITPNKTLNFKDFKITPFCVVHAFNPKFPTLGYMFETGGKKIVYASDFKKLPESAKKLIRGADLAILDCAAFERPIPNHQNFPEMLKLAKELKFKKVYLTQIGIAWPPYEKAQKYIQKYARNIFLAYDGLVLKL